MAHFQSIWNTPGHQRPQKPLGKRAASFLPCGAVMQWKRPESLAAVVVLAACSSSHSAGDAAAPQDAIVDPSDVGPDPVNDAGEPPLVDAATDPLPDGCSIDVDEVVEPAIGGCHRASLALGAGERPHVAWSGVDARGWRTEGGYSRRSDAGWETQRPFGIAHHVSLGVDGEDAFVLTVDAEARAVLWAGPTMTEVATFDDTTRRGPSGDGLLVRDGVAHVLLGPIACRNCAGGEGVDHFRAVRDAGGLGTFTVNRLSRSVGSWPYSLQPAPDGEPRALFVSGDGFNYLQPVDGEPERVSGEVTGPNFGLPLGSTILITGDGGVHVLGTDGIDGRPGGTEYVLLTQTEGGWERTSVARAPRWECPNALSEGEICEVDAERWNALSLVAEGDEPVVVLAHTIETGTRTWGCEDVCGASGCEDGGCCRSNCQWRGETTSSHELVIARVTDSGVDTHTLGELAIGEPRSVDAAAGMGGAVHLAIAERTEAEGLECSMRYVRLRCGWGGE